jgi:hypothetical protein
MEQLAALFTRKNGNGAANVESVAAWLRASAATLSAKTKATVLWLVVEQLIAKDNYALAAVWSAVGMRDTRRRGWYGWTALFYGRRAVALAKQKLFDQAIVCCLKAEQSIDGGDNLTLAWVAWARGLVALSGPDQVTAAAFLSHAADSFASFGDQFDAHRVIDDIPTSANTEEPSIDTNLPLDGHICPVEDELIADNLGKNLIRFQPISKIRR